MKNILTLLPSLFISFYISAQGICDPTGNIIIYSNYNGGDLQINIDEDIPNIKIGLCSYESWNVTITGDYVDNVVEVIYAGYDDDGTTNVSGVDAGLVDILLYPPVTLDDPDGYYYMVCAYDCDTDYIPGGCNTVDQLTDYFLTVFTGTFRYSYLQYDVFDEDEYYISEGGNCCFDGTSGPAPSDVAVTAILSPSGGCNMTSTEIVTATIKNFGPATIEAIPVNLSVDGGSATTETAFITLEAGESADYTFSETAEIASTGLHNIHVYTSLSSDSDPTNDSYDIDVFSLESPIESLAENISGCDEVILDAGNIGATYSWSTGAATQTIVVTESGTYSVTTNILGCSITESVDVIVNYFPIASFTYTDVGLTITFTNTSTDAESYVWDFGDETTSTLIDPSHSYSAEGEYTITLTVTNDCGTDVYTTVVQVYTNIEENNLSSSIEIYPNPSQGVVTVEVSFDNIYNVILVVTDISGKELFRKFEENIQSEKIDIDLSTLPDNVYNFDFIVGENRMTKQVTLFK